MFEKLDKFYMFGKLDKFYEILENYITCFEEEMVRHYKVGCIDDAINISGSADTIRKIRNEFLSLFGTELTGGCER